MAVRRLEETDLSGRAEFLDGGTGGFHLLSCFEDRDRIILIDASMDGEPPGTVRHLRPRFASDFPRSLSAHDIGLRDLIESAVLLGPLPALDLITVSIAGLQPLTLDVSSEVSAALAEVESLVRGLLAG
jgi:hydrogenase maturation protease